MKKLHTFFPLLFALFLLLGGSDLSLKAQKKGGITPQMISEWESRHALSPQGRALQNAVATTPLGTLVKNSQNRFRFDRSFSHRVESSGITNQQKSGRCWLFTGLNVYRSRVIRANDMSDFRFSHVYSFFFDQLEKSNLFLQAIIDTASKGEEDKTVEWLFKNPLSDGGQYTGISDILTKYGVVPTEAMPETYSSNNTAEMAQIIKQKLREDGLRLRQAYKSGKRGAALEKMKSEQLGEIYHILELCLGTPPKHFTYTLRDKSGRVVSSKEYTPKSFFDAFIGEDLSSSYVMLMNDPSRPYWKLYEIEYDRHSYDGRNWTFVNVPMEEIKKAAISSIKGGDAMYYSCDVGKALDRKEGTLDLANYDYESLFGVKFGMNKQERIKTFDSGSTHAMTLVAVDLDTSGKPLKWMVENSWGVENGFKGHLVMTDEWFDEYTFRLVVHKQYCSPRILEVLKGKAVPLSPWDPMF